MPPQFITNVSQGTDEWKRLRMGKLTASTMDKVVSEVTGKYSEKQAGKLAREVAIQRVLVEDTERPLDGLYWVERGKAMEPAAAQHYEKVRGRTLTEIGLIVSEDGTMACSPDRMSLIPPDDKLCGVEIKVPSTETHLEYVKAILVGGKPPTDYKWQICGSLLISQLDVWDFCSYNPRISEAIYTYEREEWQSQIATLEAATKRFEREVQEYCEIIRRVGFVEMIGQMQIRSNEEWQKMLEADPTLWAIG